MRCLPPCGSCCAQHLVQGSLPSSSAPPAVAGASASTDFLRKFPPLHIDPVLSTSLGTSRQPTGAVQLPPWLRRLEPLARDALIQLNVATGQLQHQLCRGLREVLHRQQHVQALLTPSTGSETHTLGRCPNTATKVCTCHSRAGRGNHVQVGKQRQSPALR